MLLVSFALMVVTLAATIAIAVLEYAIGWELPIWLSLWLVALANAATVHAIYTRAERLLPQSRAA